MIADMKCDGCGFDAPADFSFCPKCGRKLVQSPAPAPIAEADRRTATILFADLTGFTALSERLDPEDVRALQTDLFEEMRAVLLHEDAFIEKYVGDAVMAVFGAPAAHEDDPQRALRCALQLHQRVVALTQRWLQRLRQPLQLHIGINTGRVVAGHIGAAHGAAYAVSGDAVNVASRLQSAAGPGETWVSQETRAQAHGAFEFEPAGSVLLKGKALPLSAFRLVGSAPHETGAAPERGRLASRLAGRGEELARLRAALQALPGSGARVLSLVGEAGIGKSRLVDELVEQVRGSAGGVPIQRTGCTAHQVQPYGVAARFFRSGFGLDPADTLGAVQAKVEAGLSMLGAQPDEIALVVPMAGYVLGLAALQELRHLEPERLQRQITMALRIVLDCQLRRSPLVVVVEDIQWADAASLELLATMADWLHPRPLLLLLTARPGADTSGFDTGRAPHAVLALEPLGPAQIEEALAGYFGDTDSSWMPQALRTRLIERAGGNSFFLEEMLRSLVVAGVLVEGEQGWSCDERQAAAEVPATLEGLLLSRIDRLAPAERRCLQEAAVLGTAFDLGLLQALAGDSFDTSRVDALCAAGYLTSAAPGRYRFCHPIARDVWSTRTCCCAGAPSCTARSAGCSMRASAAAQRASKTWKRWATTSASATNRCAAHRGWSLPATGRAASMPTTTRSACTSARTRRWAPAAPSRRGSTSTNGSATSSAPPGSATRPSSTTAACVTPPARPAIGDARRVSTASWPRCTGTPVRANAVANASMPVWRCWPAAMTASRPRTCCRRWGALPFAPATTKPRCNGPSAHWPTRSARRCSGPQEPTNIATPAQRPRRR